MLTSDLFAVANLLVVSMLRLTVANKGTRQAYDYRGKAVNTTEIGLPFDCHSTALRPLDDIRYDRRRCGLSK